ncbi:Fimbrial protein [Rhodanobacter sp. Root179]|uniref:pilin n=1 Tax=Rhodanobacter sp. Root179 TaxID=1736482 RepID=UPI000700CD11|nr:pilin [Rhodanobacter sp. Root179]KRB39520.1 fimbrial protein [Rhodanobacter sp. Root179]
MKTMQKGFTLIELMIVVAIIAILAAIALPQYQNYVARSQATAGLADITPAKTAIEEMINNGKSASVAANYTLVGIQKTTERCDITIGAIASDGSGSSAVACTLKGNPKVAGKTITWGRNVSGVWSCVTTGLSQFAPKGCSGT